MLVAMTLEEGPRMGWQSEQVRRAELHAMQRQPVSSSAAQVKAGRATLHVRGHVPTLEYSMPNRCMWYRYARPSNW